MSPVPSRTGADESRPPRASGDEPDRGWFKRPLALHVVVRPARAGMSPTLPRSVVRRPCPPRASGDEPAGRLSLKGCYESAPRERG